MAVDLAQIEAERQAIFEDERRLKSRVDADEENARRRLAAQFTIAERLMRRVQVTRFKTVFEDDLGEFPIETRQMTGSERYRALGLNQMLSQSGEDVEKYAEAINGFKQLVAELCITPGVAEYLQSDDVSDDVVIALVMNTLRQSMRLVGEAITSFRSQ